MYSNEETVGAALKKWGGKREDVFITTKVGGKDARKSLEASLSKLGVDFVGSTLPSAVIRKGCALISPNILSQICS